ncbi:MAG TPA: lysophospholipid acyltransferase family protein [Xanthobacteraceae bacterium]|nr:lysophospholipid acyltransferase family protein [Xanthobacteraceae bacterium]
MIIIRSVVFNVLFYLVLAAYLMVAMPTLLLPRWGIIRLAQHWGRVNLHLLRIVCGITVEWRGLEKIPAGAFLVAAKHQSVWETFALLTLFRDPTYILKRELLWLPLFGWAAWRAGMIPVDRGGGKPALAAMAARVRDALAAGKQIIIFPEGTRRPPGAEPKYKFGIAHLYGEGVAACLPIALNSGLFWPRRQFLRRPGTITVEILDPIAPGLAIDDFFARLQRDLEAATARLIAQGRRDIATAETGSAAA